MSLKWGLVIPAGGLVKDPLATALGTPRKALAMIGGKPCVERTLSAAREAGFDRIAVVSGDDVLDIVGSEVFVPERGGQIENAVAGVEHLAEVEYLLFMPADTPFLTAKSVRHFVDAVDRQIDPNEERWFAAGLCPYSEFLKVLPGFEHPHIKFKDGDYMSGAFYAVSRVGFSTEIEKFKNISSNRKSQFKMAMQIGLVPLLRYFFHQVDLEEAKSILARFFGGQAILVTDCDPWAMADIDTVDEYQRLARESGEGPKA
jgi:CTP:molybdopterin cytidylyltransferase MocA